MISTLQLNLLGPLEISLDGSPLTSLRSPKATALFIYLACNPGPHRREFLADLLWDTPSTSQSLSNLRTLLTRLRRHLDSHLQITDQTLAAEPAPRVILDTDAMETGLSAAGHLSPATAPQLQATLALYRGDFLAGFALNGAPTFDEWAVVERERLHFLALQGYRRLADYYQQSADFPAAIHTARAWLAIDPLDEKAHGHLLRGLAAAGQEAAALDHYQQCSRLLRRELDVDPSAELQMLHSRISAGAFSPAAFPVRPDALAPPARPGLPRRLTSFLGREQESAHIRRLFAQATTRLVTLAGEGGVGKSSLALDIGLEVLEKEGQAVHFAPLADVEAEPAATLPRRLATALAQAVGLHFPASSAATDPVTHLFSFLRTRSLLLILDNFEHLGSNAAFVVDLLRAAPDCRLLVTARGPLQVMGETVVRLDGLPIPPENPHLPVPDTAYAGVALFVERARQRKTRFGLTADDRQALAHLCRLVAGNPLALELAAAWVEHFSLPEMVARLETNMLDFLRNPAPGVDPRHISLRRVMESSWQLLPPSAQPMLAQLSIFRGGFHRDAALAVTDGSLDGLVALVNASLLQQQEAGRYELHEMVRQFAGERLAAYADGGEGSQAGHARYYLALVGRVEPNSLLIEEMSKELANVRKAWDWAVARQDLSALAGAGSGLWNFYLRKGLFQEAEDAFGRAIDSALGTPPGRVGRRRALAALRVAQAVFLNIRSNYTEAIAVAEEAVRYALQEEDETIIARGYLQWGTALYRQGHYTDAIARFRLALLAAQDGGLTGDQADILRQRGVAWLEQGDFAQARADAQAALALFRRTGNQLGTGNTLTDLGWLEQRRQNFAEARHYLDEARQVHEAIGNRHGITVALLNLGIVQQMIGDFSAAYETYLQLFRGLDEVPDRYHHSLINQSLGVLLSRLGDYSAARSHLLTSLEIDRSVGDRGGPAWSYNALGMIHNHLGEAKTGLAYHRKALAIGREQGARTVEGIALLGIGQDLQALARWQEAAVAYEEAMALQRELQQNVRVVESRSGLARCLLALDEKSAALAQVEAILDYLSTQSLDGAAQPALIYWNCYTVLRGLDDPRAAALLADAFDLVQGLASRIHDPRRRSTFLTAMPVHRRLSAEVQALRITPPFGGETRKSGEWGGTDAPVQRHTGIRSTQPPG